MGAMLMDIPRVIAACFVAFLAGAARLQDPVPATMHEMALWVGLAFFGTLALLGAFRSPRNKRPS